MNLPTAATQSTVHALPPGEMDTRLRGRWLLLTRVVWISIALLALGLYVASIPSTLVSLHALCTDVTAPCSSVGYITPDYARALQTLGLSLDTFALYEVALLIVFAAVYVAIGVMLFWRKSDDRMALFVPVSDWTICPALDALALGCGDRVLDGGWLFPFSAF